MIISCATETKPLENRVAITPNITKKLADLGLTVKIEHNAGLKSGFLNEDYINAGAIISDDVYKDADIICQIWAPKNLKTTATIIANFSDNIDNYKSHHGKCFALELMPRISKAQSMDILSSQSNLAGYKAVLETLNHFNKAVPMMMTAGGTIAPAKFLILGVGVAGLQAIATAKRLGGVVFASDIRPETKEQVESLGAKFIEGQHILEQLKKTDIVIATALSMGKKAPTLVSKQMLNDLPSGSILLDMASSQGGNIEGSIDNQVTIVDKKTIIGNSNLASLVPYSASSLYAQNIFNFLTTYYNKETKSFAFDLADEIIKAILINGDAK